MNNNKALQITVDVTDDGLLPVNLLAEASGLSKAQVKDAMLKGAVWVAKKLPAIKAKPLKAKPAVTADEFEEPDYYGVRARALKTQALVSEGLPLNGPLDGSLNESIDDSFNDPLDGSINDSTDSAQEMAGAVAAKSAGPRHSKPRRLRRIKSQLKAGDQLTLNYDAAVLAGTCPDAKLIADEGNYSVWYKPAGMLCQGSRWGDHTTLNRWAEKHLQPERSAFIVHRIDRMASGLVVLAHSKKTASYLAKQFADRKVEKSYRVIVAGEVDLSLPHLIDSDIEGKSAITTITDKWLAQGLEKNFNDSAACSVLDIDIETGRKHQIRRHLSSLGHPVLGDRLYGNSSVKPGDADLPLDSDLQLTAIKMAFIAPENDLKQCYALPEALLDQVFKRPRGKSTSGA